MGSFCAADSFSAVSSHHRLERYAAAASFFPFCFLAEDVTNGSELIVLHGDRYMYHKLDYVCTPLWFLKSFSASFYATKIRGKDLLNKTARSDTESAER